MDNVHISAPYGFVVDFAALIARIGSADGSDVHSLLNPVSIEYSIPGCCRCLNAVTSLYRFFSRGSGDNVAIQFPHHPLGEAAPVIFVGTEDLDLLELEQTA